MSEQTAVKPQGTVNINRVEGEQSAPPAAEETMAQFAARREAEMRGQKPPEVKKEEAPAAVVKADAPAAATDEVKKDPPAAATDDPAADDKKDAKVSAAEEEIEDENPEQQIEETHKAKKGIERKFSKLTSARDKAEADAKAKAAEAEEARQRNATLEAENKRLKEEAEARAAAPVVPAVPAIEDDPEPVESAFEDPDQYQKALISHSARQELRLANARTEAAAKTAREAADKKATEAQQAKVQEQITALHKTFNERVESAKADIPDYDAKVTNNEKLILRNDVFFTIEQAEMAPYILAHLADNPDEAASLNKLPPMAAAMRIGEITTEIRIARKPKPSAARPPVKPVQSRASPERKTPDEESMTEYADRRQREEAAARAGRKNSRLLN